jgi:phosphate transport system protein
VPPARHAPWSGTPMPTRLEESLERDIERIKEEVLKMSALAERSLRDCVRALDETSRQISHAVILRDQYIDEKEKEIDRLCLEFLVRQQPVGSHLRFAYSTIKINLELERVGDYAESVARQLLRLDRLPSPPSSLKKWIVEMADIAIPMLHDAIEAFVQQDPERAKKAMEVEPAVDALQRKYNADLVDLLRERKLPPEAIPPLMTIGRRFERVADQARNVCMEVLYMCTGEYAKHPGSESLRILFVDEYNSCRSQMAEAIAQSLDLPEFLFSSAGVEPRPIDRNTLQFMREKGFDLTRVAPKTIFQVPNLDHYQVIVALAAEAQQAFPRRPRKTVLLDWHVADPSRVEGSPDQIRAAYEATYQFIESHLRDLIEAIRVK